MPRTMSLKSIRAQIASLERKAELLKNKAKPGVARVAKLIKKFKLTPADLKTAFSSSSKTSVKRKKRTRKGVKAAVKYRDSKGNTWTGRGRAPRWLMAAEKSGHERDEFLIKRA